MVHSYEESQRGNEAKKTLPSLSDVKDPFENTDGLNVTELFEIHKLLGDPSRNNKKCLED